jgi:glycosyltransferase involved in cell wall biosynthesis
MDLQKSEVTVVIPFYNAEKYITRALDSVFKQTYRYWQLILIDDASTDDSVKVVEPYLTDPRVTLVSNPGNMGQAKSLNRGLARVTTPYLVQLDSDDWFVHHTLEVLLREAKNHGEEVAVFGGDCKVVYENEWGERLQTVKLRGRSYTDKYQFMLANQTMLPRFYRTSALRRVGGWSVNDPFQGRVLEDRAIQLKLIEHYHFHSVHETLYHYRRHTDNQTENIATYAKAVEWIVRDALKRWGDEYEPIFIKFAKGWKKVVRLEPKKSGLKPIQVEDMIDEHYRQYQREEDERGLHDRDSGV